MNTITEERQKRVMTLSEACEYTGYKRGYMYKLTSAGIIPFSKPRGKNLFFDREKLDEFLLGNASQGKEKREIQDDTFISTSK